MLRMSSDRRHGHHTTRRSMAGLERSFARPIAEGTRGLPGLVGPRGLPRSAELASRCRLWLLGGAARAATTAVADSRRGRSGGRGCRCASPARVVVEPPLFLHDGPPSRSSCPDRVRVHHEDTAQARFRPSNAGALWRCRRSAQQGTIFPAYALASLLRQVTQEQVADLLDERLIPQTLRLVEGRLVNEGLSGLDADVTRQLQVARTDFVSMGFEVGKGERAQGVPLEIRDLYTELVVKLRVLEVEAHHEADELRDGLPEGEAPESAELAEHPVHELLVVASAQLGEQRILVREVLIERAHRDARDLRDAVRAEPCAAFGRENASCRFKDRL